MYVCLCKGITDSQIHQAVTQGATTFQAVRRELGVATQCCKCLAETRAVIDEALQEHTTIETPLYYSA